MTDATERSTRTEDAHAALVAALDRGEPFDGQAVERIDTHAAHVFLVGERAFKLKRPIRLSVLDFSTVEARRQALEAELRLNRRTAPEIYLRVAPLTSADDHLALDEGGDVVDWLLEMRRFPEADKLDRIAEQGPLAAALAGELGRAVARFHTEAEPRPDKGGRDAMTDVVAGNREDLDAAPAGLFARADVEAVDANARAALERHGARLDARRAGGFVRHCHGDLHLGNIVHLERGVVPFDCIEFSEDIACVDTMYDLAFVLMDLVERDQRTAAWLVLDAYLAELDDLGGLAPLPFFMAVRATIRAKVMGLAVDDVDAASHGAAAARRYLALARLLEPGPAPRLIGVGGLSGSGKTTLARALAPHLDPAPGAVLLRSDVERKRLWGVPADERLPATAYRREVSDEVFARLRARASELLAGGTSVIVDAVHGEPEQRRALAAVAAAAGARFDGLWLEAPAHTLIERVAGRSGDASDADETVVRRQLEGDVGPIAWTRVAADGDPASVVERMAGALELGRGKLAELG